jgi:hypothetical protein
MGASFWIPEKTITDFIKFSKVFFLIIEFLEENLTPYFNAIK